MITDEFMRDGLFYRPYINKALPVPEFAIILKWEYSYTFNQWRALVRFRDGYECYTDPVKE